VGNHLNLSRSGIDESGEFSSSFISRVENWRKWLLSGAKRGRAGSAEGGYRPPPCWNPPEPRVVVDQADAIEVNEVWKKLPYKSRDMIKYSMVWREHWRATCRKLNLLPDEYDVFLGYSLRLMKDMLDN
jgi:hypothetical protein